MEDAYAKRMRRAIRSAVRHMWFWSKWTAIYAAVSAALWALAVYHDAAAPWQIWLTGLIALGCSVLAAACAYRAELLEARLWDWRKNDHRE